MLKPQFQNARRFPWRRAFFLFGAALMVKAAVLVALRGHPLLQPRGDMDTAVYVALARQSAAQAFFVSPLYLYFLRATGVSLLAARIVQILLGSIAVVLIFDTARHWFGDRAATISAALALLTGVISFYEVTILQAALDPFLVALTLWLLTLAVRSFPADVASNVNPADQSARWKSTLPFALTGVALGLFVLNRPNALLWFPVLVAGLLWLRLWRGAIVLFIAFWLPIVPVTIRNYEVSHQVVLIASHGGLNFYIGNNAEADGTYHHVPGVRPTIAGQEDDAPRVASAVLGRPVTAGDASSYFYRRALDWIRSNPGKAVLLSFRKIAYTFNQADLALNYSYSYFTHDVSSPLRFLIVGPWLLFPLGLAAMAWRVRDAEFALWASFVPVYAISVALFFVSSRYRLPLLIPMCVASGAMFVKPRIPAWVVAAVLAVGVCWNFGLDDGRAHERTNMIVYLIEQHRFDEATSLIDDTAVMTRDPATLFLRSGGAFAAAGDMNRALESFRRLDPAEIGVAQAKELAMSARRYGIASVQSSHADQALAAFDTAHKLDPTDASDLLNIAVLQAQRGDFAAARESAESALQLRPGYPQAEGLLRAIEGR